MTIISDQVRDDDSGVTYTPITGGWRADKDNGERTYIVLNPSTGSDRDGEPNVFLYIGPTGIPGQDDPVTFYDLFLDAAEYRMVES